MGFAAGAIVFSARAVVPAPFLYARVVCIISLDVWLMEWVEADVICLRPPSLRHLGLSVEVCLASHR